MTITRKDILNGLFIYSIGDTIASLIINQFLISRLLGICFIGAIIYAFEIPNYFRWIDKFSSSQETKPFSKSLQRTGLALLYFNPLWIVRHLLFINLFSQDWNNINWNLLSIGFKSFLFNIPISFIANYLIQNKISYKYRFISSAIFSALMAIYYALSAVIFK